MSKPSHQDWLSQPPHHQPHLMTVDPQLRPAPKPAQAMTSPFLILPDATASESASGMDPADVFPYSSRLWMTCENIGESVRSLG